MAYTPAQLRAIYDRTTGKCHICHKKLAITNYGRSEERGCWEVEHSRPRAKGGSDHGNNLYAACIPCNRSKQAGSTKAARARNGKSRAPLSREKRSREKSNSALAGAAIGAFGGLPFGPVGVAVGTALGAIIGGSADPDAD